MSDSHREQATTTDFAKPRDARQFWRVAGLARFSKRAELDYVLRSSEAVLMSGDPFRFVWRDRGACFFGSGSDFWHWWRKRKEPRRAWGWRVGAGLPCVGGSSSWLLPRLVYSMRLAFLGLLLLRMRRRIGHA